MQDVAPSFLEAESAEEALEASACILLSDADPKAFEPVSEVEVTLPCFSAAADSDDAVGAGCFDGGSASSSAIETSASPRNLDPQAPASVGVAAANTFAAAAPESIGVASTQDAAEGFDTNFAPCSSDGESLFALNGPGATVSVVEGEGDGVELHGTAAVDTSVAEAFSSNEAGFGQAFDEGTFAPDEGTFAP
eukprot:5234243-Pleurochrysis_carterae.AAC.1